MSLADDIRKYVCNQYINPARTQKQKQVTISVCKVHDEMGLKQRCGGQRYQAVSGALRTNKFETLQRVHFIKSVGTPPNEYLTFELL